jgi:hypothetical protein
MIPSRAQVLQTRIRWLTALFILGLFLSGVTAIPLRLEVQELVKVTGADQGSSGLTHWLVRIRDALDSTETQQPFLFYGTDWLAFGHFMIALVFVGAWRDPVRNRWLFDFGLIACGLVIPFAMSFGAIRGIPLGWRLIDCSFGILGAIPLWLCRQWARELEKAGFNARQNP